MTGLATYGARGPLSDPPQLGEYEVVLAWQAQAAIRAAHEAQVFIHEGAAERRGYEQGLARAIRIVSEAQDTAQSGEGIVVTITLGAGRGSVYVNRDAVLTALRALEEKSSTTTKETP